NQLLGSSGDNNAIDILRSQSSAIYFLLTAQSTPVAGQPCQFVVDAINAAGATIESYNGTVHFTSNDPTAILPPDLKLTNGVGVVSVTFNAVGHQYLRATDKQSFKSTGTSATFFVSASVGHGSAAKLDAPTPTQLLAGATFPLVVT